MSDDNIDIDDIDLDGLDDPMDFSFDPEETTDDRTPVQKVASGAIEGLTDTETIVGAGRTVLDNALPKGFSVALSDSRRALSEGRGLYDKTIKELEEPINNLKDVVNEHADKLSFLPTSWVNKIKEATKRDKGRRQESLDEVRNNNITSSINSIFTRQLNLESARMVSDSQKQDLERKRDEIKFETSTSLLTDISEATRRQIAYTEQIESQYQQKMLELSHRQYYMLKDIAEHTRLFSSSAVSELKAITKNTGLPEFVKMRGSEAYMQLTRERLLGKVNDTAISAISGFGSRLKDNLGNKLSELTASVADGINSAADMGDMLAQVSELSEMDPSASKEKTAGGFAAKLAVGELAKRGGKKLGEYLAKNPTMMKYSDKLLYLSENAPEVFQELANRPTESLFVQTLQDLVPTIRGDQEGVVHNLSETATEMALFDQMTRRSIVEVIPGFLSRILKGVTELATGETADRLVYSAESESFVGLTEEANRLKDRLVTKEDAAKSVNRSYDLIDALDKKATLGHKEKAALMRYFLDESNSGKLFDLNKLSGLTNEDVLGGDDLSNIIKNNFLGEDGKAAKGNLELSRIYRDIRQGYGNTETQLGLLNATGNKDVARALGIIGSANGKDRIDHEFKKDLFVDQANRVQGVPSRVHRHMDIDTSEKEEEKLTLKEQLAKKLAVKKRPEEKFGSDALRKENTDSTFTPIKRDVKIDGNIEIDTTELKNAIDDLPVKLREELEIEIRGMLGVPVHVLTMPQSMGGGDSGIELGPDSPLYTMLMDNLDGVNSKLAEIVTSTRDLQVNQYSFDPSNLVPNMPELGLGDKLSGVMDKAKGAVGFAGSLLGSYYTTLGKTTVSAANLGRKGLEKANDLRKSLQSKLTRDIYIPGLPNPVLTFQGLKNKEYYDAISGEVLIAFEDIKGPVMDASGNILLTYENVKDGLTDKWGEALSIGKTGMDFIKEHGGGLISKIGKINTMHLSFLKGLADKGVGFANKVMARFTDIYVMGDPRPRLLANVMKAGGYFSAATGEAIKSLSDIDGDIVDAAGNVVLTLDEMRSGLLDRFGKKINLSGIGNVLALGQKGLSIGKNLVTGYFNKVSSVGGAIVDGFKGLLSGSGFNLDFGMGGGANTELIEKIYEYLQLRWPLDEGYASDNVIYGMSPEKFEETKVKRTESLLKNVESVKASLKESVVDTLKPLQPKMGDYKDIAEDKLNSVKGKISDKYSDISERVSDSKTKLIDEHFKEKIAPKLDKVLEDVRGLNPFRDSNVENDIDVGNPTSSNRASVKDLLATLIQHIKGEEIENDDNGDGLRDGGWRAQLKKRKEQLLNKVNFTGKKHDKDIEDAEKSGDSVGLLAGLFGGIGEKVTSAFSGMKGLLESLMGIFGAGGLASKFFGGKGGVDIDMPDGGKVKGKGGLFSKLGRAAKGAGSLLARGATFAAPALLGAGKAALAAGGALLSAPVLAAAGIGALGYGGYKAYKYFSDRSDPEGLDKLRYLQYGTNLEDKSSLANTRQLESAVMDEIEWNGDSPVLDKTPKEFAEEYAEDFGVNTDDPRELHQWSVWFAKRFVPTLMTHLVTARRMEVTDDVTDIEDDIDDDMRSEFMKAAIVPLLRKAEGPMAVKSNPWPQNPATDNESQLNEILKKELGTLDPTPIKSKNKDEDKEKGKEENMRRKSKDKTDKIKDLSQAALYDESSTPRAETSIEKVANAPVQEESSVDKRASILEQSTAAVAINQNLSAASMAKLERISSEANRQRERSIRLQEENNLYIRKIYEHIHTNLNKSGSAPEEKKVPPAPKQEKKAAPSEVKLQMDVRRHSA